MSDWVISHQDGRCATITLNQPARRNPISMEMRAAIMGALEGFRAIDTVRSVILTGSGAAFCSGLDLQSLHDSTSSTDAPGEFAAHQASIADSNSISDFYTYLLEYPKPLIAAVNGPAVAGGAGLALLCDATIFSEKASICFSEVRLGFVPAIVGVYLQLSIGIKRARELMLSARTVSAHESLEFGVASAVVPPETLLAECAMRAAQFANNGPQALAATKGLLAAQLKHKSLLDLSMAVELNAQVRHSSECKEGVAAFLRKEKPYWTNP